MPRAERASIKGRAQKSWGTSTKLIGFAGAGLGGAGAGVGDAAVGVGDALGTGVVAGRGIRSGIPGRIWAGDGTGVSACGDSVGATVGTGNTDTELAVASGVGV